MGDTDEVSQSVRRLLVSSRLLDSSTSGAIGGDEAFDRPRRATDEEAVDVGKGGEFPGIAWVDAAAIENRNLAAKRRE